MSIHDTVATLSRETRTRLAALHGRYEDGELSWAQFMDLGAAEASRRSQAASSLAALAVAAELSRLSGRVRAPTGGGAGYDIETAARSQLNDQTSTQSYQQDGNNAMGIAGAAVVMAAYQDTTARSMRDQGITFSRRVVEPDACPICQDMADMVLPTSENHYHHKGCACIAVPVSENGEDQ